MNPFSLNHTSTATHMDEPHRCFRCGAFCQGGEYQNLAGWEGRQLAIERERFRCADFDACFARRIATVAA